MSAFRVLVVDRDPLTRAFLGRLLERLPGYEAIVAIGEIAPAIELAWFWEPDVIVIDVEGFGIPACQRLARASPCSEVIVFSRHVSPDEEAALRKASACTCLSKAQGVIPLMRRLEAARSKNAA